MSPTLYPEWSEEPANEPAIPDEAPEMPPPERESGWESPFSRTRRTGQVAYRGTTSDPVFGYLIAVALSVGLMPLIPENADLRYTVIWIVMAGFGVLAWLMGNTARIWTETLENLTWGVVFALLIGLPFLFVGGETLRATSVRLFVGMSRGEVLAFLVFVIPCAETLFFRGVLQENRPFWLVGILATIWSAFVFFPMLDVRRFPSIAIITLSAMLLMNMMYGYVRQRNGLAAAWICQILAGLVILFVPQL